MGGNFANGAVSGAFVYMYNHGLTSFLDPQVMLDTAERWINEDKSKAANETIGVIFGGVTYTFLIAVYGTSPPGWVTIGASAIGWGVQKTWNYYSPKPWLNELKD